MRSHNVLLAALLAAGFAAAPVGAQSTSTTDAANGRVIVQLRDAGASSDAPDRRVLSADRVTTLGARVGLSLQLQSGPAPGMGVVSAPGMSAEALAERLAADPDVLFAEPDQRRHIRQVPNDPRYSEQWLLQNGQPAAINALGAWEVTTGSSDVVVAVIDTGVRFEHEDLVDRLLPGYDFITIASMAGDGDGRDADASDPGDFLSAQDLQQSFFAGCGDGPGGNQPSTSSWHGTRVAGVIAATGNNSRGIAGVSWAARLLPVRALGKCGGFDSDIIAAMRWSGGLAVPGVPSNPNPARIINMSLGGPGSCTVGYQQTVAELRSAGVMVIAAAGNDTFGVETPGNCPGVFTVAGLRHVGTKVGYSSNGPEVDIAAPAGNCPSATGPCEFQIPATTNLGLTVPAGNGYTDGNNPTYGTSFAAPQAAGVAALMLSVHSGLQLDALSERMREAARPFPQEEGLPICPQVDIFSGQCSCTTEACGAGMLDARGAVLAALRPQAVVAASGGAANATLDGSASSASSGRQLVSWQWQLVQGAGAGAFTQPQSPTTGFMASLPGDYTLRLTVTDNNGQRDTRDVTVNLSEGSVIETPQPTPEPTPDPGTGGDDGVRQPRGGGGAVDGGALGGLLALLGAAYWLRRRDPAANAKAVR